MMDASPYGRDVAGIQFYHPSLEILIGRGTGGFSTIRCEFHLK